MRAHHYYFANVGKVLICSERMLDEHQKKHLNIETKMCK